MTTSTALKPTLTTNITLPQQPGQSLTARQTQTTVTKPAPLTASPAPKQSNTEPVCTIISCISTQTAIRAAFHQIQLTASLTAPLTTIFPTIKPTHKPTPVSIQPQSIRQPSSESDPTIPPTSYKLRDKGRPPATRYDQPECGT